MLPLTPRAKRRIVALAGRGGVDDVHAALAYACRLLHGKSVAYEWDARDIDNDDWHGVSYVDRAGMPTVAYDWTRERFVWDYRP
jgi:hypothetical protein